MSKPLQKMTHRELMDHALIVGVQTSIEVWELNEFIVQLHQEVDSSTSEDID